MLILSCYEVETREHRADSGFWVIELKFILLLTLQNKLIMDYPCGYMVYRNPEASNQTK